MGELESLSRHERRAVIAELRSRAVSRFGLAPGHALCRAIDRLEKVWRPSEVQRIQRALANLEMARERHGHCADRVPVPGAVPGQIPIAAAPGPSGFAPVFLELTRLVLHSIVAGLPGAGKTHFVRRLLEQIVIHAPWVRCLLFDPTHSFASFERSPDWVNIKWQDSRLNPAVPPDGYPWRQWLSEVVDRFSRGELKNSKYLLNRRWELLYEEALSRAARGEEFLPPSPVDLRNDLEYLRCRPYSADERYRQSGLNVLDGRIRSTGDVYDCAVGMERLLTNTRARIDTAGLSPVESLEFYISSYIHFLYRRRSLEPVVDPPTLHTIVVVEEAQTLLERRDDDNIPMYEEILLRARALGLGFLFIAQDLNRIDPTVLAACSNLFLFAQSTGFNKRAAYNIADLSSEEMRLLGQLQTGEVLIRLAGHPTFPHPFIARTFP